MRYQFPLAVAGLALVAILAVVLFGLSQAQTSEANHGQTAVYPQIDYVALDAVVTGNAKNALAAGEPPWDACVDTTQGSPVNIDIVVDKIPVVPDTDDGGLVGSLFGVTGVQFLVEYDSTKLSLGGVDATSSLISQNGGSIGAPSATQQAVGPPRVDLLSIVDINTSTASREENIMGTGMRLPFTVDGAATGFAQVTLLESFGPFQTKVTAGTGQEQTNLTINNFGAGPTNGDANDLQTIRIAVDPATCAGAPEPDADSDGVPDADDNCPNTPNANQSNVDGDSLGDLCDTETGIAGVGDCGDGFDNDGDGATDGADTGCAADSDGDGVPNSSDNCPNTPNTNQSNVDGDSLGDLCDTETGVTGIGDCGDGKDNDGDGNTDGADSGCAPDSDGDGVPDGTDNCPDDANPGQEDTVHPGSDGGDACEDFDDDSVVDGDDNCPDDANTNQSDNDDDGTGDVCDTEEGVDGVGDCGDGDDNDGDGDTDGDDSGCLPDSDGDGIPDGDDTETGVDGVGDCGDGFDNDGDEATDGDDSGCLPDADGDGVADSSDNCPNDANAAQTDTDGDGLGDACDSDDDNDGDPDTADNCPLTANSNQANADGDSLGDACDSDDDNDGDPDTADNCPLTSNPGQENNDGDSLGDACDPDDDNDGVNDTADKCPGTPAGASVNADGCSTAQLGAVQAPTATLGVTGLPDTGGEPESSGVNMLVILLAGAALLAPASAILWAQSRRQNRS